MCGISIPEHKNISQIIWEVTCNFKQISKTTNTKIISCNVYLRQFVILFVHVYFVEIMFFRVKNDWLM